MAIRTHRPIPLNLAPFVWKMLTNCSTPALEWSDLEQVDLNYAHSLRAIRDLKLTSDQQLTDVVSTETFEGLSFSGIISFD